MQKFIRGEDIGFIMRNADLVIARGGTNTLLELAYLGVPTVIIPIPYVVKNEQVVNAKFFSKAGLGIYLPQQGLTAHKLLEQIKEMISKKDYFKKQVQDVKQLVILDAAKKITQQILLLGSYED